MDADPACVNLGVGRETELDTASRELSDRTPQNATDEKSRLGSSQWPCVHGEERGSLQSLCELFSLSLRATTTTMFEMDGYLPTEVEESLTQDDTLSTCIVVVAHALESRRYAK